MADRPGQRWQDRPHSPGAPVLALSPAVAWLGVSTGRAHAACVVNSYLLRIVALRVVVHRSQPWVDEQLAMVAAPDLLFRICWTCAMAESPKAVAALALHRFGLGPRLGSIAAIASDPRGALLAELDSRDAGRIAAASLPTSAQAF